MRKSSQRSITPPSGSGADMSGAVVLQQNQGVGDQVVFTALLRDFAAACPDVQVFGETSCPQVLLGYPHYGIIPPKTARRHLCTYCTEDSLTGMHFCHAFHARVEAAFSVAIPRGPARGVLYPQPLQAKFQNLLSRPYVVIDAGYKMDFTAKHWGHERYQELVRATPKIVWVQVGSDRDKHRPLDGAINLIGQTSIGDLISLIQHSHGVVSPVSCPVHIAGALGRQCITIAGGREPASWEGYPGHYYLHTYHEGEPACWRSSTIGECRHGARCGDETVPSCMSLITVDKVLEIINGDAWITGGQVDYREYQAVASGGRETCIAIRCGGSRCGEEDRRRQQAAERADRRNRRVMRDEHKEEGLPAAAEGQAVLKERPVRTKRIPSWRKRGSEPEDLVQVPATAGGVLYVGANNCIKCGDFLGDTITQVIAQSIVWESIRPERTIISLYTGNPLNLLWDGYIKRSQAKVVMDAPINGNIAAKYAMLDARRTARQVGDDAFDHYRECYRCMDQNGRTAALGARNAVALNSIIETYYYGQESALPMPYWSSCPQHFALPRWAGGGDYVFISPLEKCQNNAIYSFPMWREVVLLLLEAGLNVVVNDRSKFCHDLKVVKTFLPFREMFDQIAAARVVACGNTGTMWAAGACGTPSVICESPGVAMPMYSVHRARLAGVRYVCPEPDPSAIATRIIDAYEEIGA